MSMHTWQFAKALYAADLHGWTRFISMQNYYNLLYREEEREMLPFCADQGVGCIPWSPLARGRLTRPWATETDRSQADAFARTAYDDDDKVIVDAVIEVSALRGATPAQVALAWTLSKPGVVSAIIGAAKPTHLAEAAAAVDLRLEDAETELLEAPYLPKLPHGIDL